MTEISHMTCVRLHLLPSWQPKTHHSHTNTRSTQVCRGCCFFFVGVWDCFCSCYRKPSNSRDASWSWQQMREHFGQICEADLWPSPSSPSLPRGVVCPREIKAKRLPVVWLLLLLVVMFVSVFVVVGLCLPPFSIIRALFGLFAGSFDLLPLWVFFSSLLFLSLPTVFPGKALTFPFFAAEIFCFYSVQLKCNGKRMGRKHFPTEQFSSPG